MGFYRNWFLASRPWSFTMTAISVSVGSALAALDGPFSWPLALLALLSAVLLHAATNLINDYYDVVNGIDTVQAATAQYRPHPLVEGLIPVEQVRWVAYGLFALAAGMPASEILVWGSLTYSRTDIKDHDGIFFTDPEPIE